MVINSGTPYYYIIGQCNGKTVFLGGYSSEQLAYTEAFRRTDWDGGHFEVKPYHTRDLQEAIRRWKHEHSHNTMSISEGMERVSHG